MRPTTKMYLARSSMKRDSRGRFTSESGGDYRSEGGRGGTMGGYAGGDMRGGRMGGEGANNRSRNYGNGYGDNRRGGSRNEMTGDDDFEMYGGDRSYVPNYNIPEGRDLEHGQKNGEKGGTTNSMGRRIGFQSRAQGMGGGNRENNVVSMQRGHSSHREHQERHERHEQPEQSEHEQKQEFTPELAEEWVQAMKNVDGTKGPHWNHDQIRQVMQHYNIRDAEPHEFYAIMNAMYSDFCAVAKKFGVDTSGFYAELAKAWLQDEDAVEDKAAAYYCYVVKH